MASGYECPVCSLPQQDSIHLANHMALTAILHEEEHHEWLDETVPEWNTQAPDMVAEEIVPHVNETTYPVVFEDTTDTSPDHQHPTPSGATSERDAITARVIEQTREMMNEADDTESTDTA